MLQFTTVRQGQGGTLEARDGETLVGLITFVPAWGMETRRGAEPLTRVNTGEFMEPPRD